MPKIVKIRKTGNKQNSAHVITLPKDIVDLSNIAVGNYLLVRYVKKTDEIVLTKFSNVEEIEELQEDIAE